MILDNWLAQRAADLPRPHGPGRRRARASPTPSSRRRRPSAARRLAARGRSPRRDGVLELPAGAEYAVLAARADEARRDRRSAQPTPCPRAEREAQSSSARPPCVVLSEPGQLIAHRGRPAAARRARPRRDPLPHHDQRHVGRPRARSALTYGNHLWSAVGSAFNLGVDPADRWLCCLPLHHVGGLSIVMRSVIYGTGGDGPRRLRRRRRRGVARGRRRHARSRSSRPSSCGCSRPESTSRDRARSSSAAARSRSR